MRREILALMCAGDCGDDCGRAVLVEVVCLNHKNRASACLHGAAVFTEVIAVDFSAVYFSILHNVNSRFLMS